MSAGPRSPEIESLDTGDEELSEALEDLKVIQVVSPAEREQFDSFQGDFPRKPGPESVS